MSTWPITVRVSSPCPLCLTVMLRCLHLYNIFIVIFLVKSPMFHQVVVITTMIHFSQFLFVLPLLIHKTTNSCKRAIIPPRDRHVIKKEIANRVINKYLCVLHLPCKIHKGVYNFFFRNCISRPLRIYFMDLNSRTCSSSFIANLCGMVLN